MSSASSVVRRRAEHGLIARREKRVVPLFSFADHDGAGRPMISLIDKTVITESRNDRNDVRNSRFSKIKYLTRDRVALDRARLKRRGLLLLLFTPPLSPPYACPSP